MRALFLLFALAFSAPPCASEPTAPASYTGRLLRGETSKSFADVVQELDFAISERNFRITGRNTIGKGLRDRGYDKFPDVEVIHFCSLEYAREVLLLDPNYVAMMPCRVTVHEEGPRTVVTMVLLPESHPNPRVVAFAVRMNGLLIEIFNFVMEADAS